MGMGVESGKRGILSEVNVVPLIDILLVLLVIFMVVSHHQRGLKAVLPQVSGRWVTDDPPAPIIVQVASDGAVRINQSAVRPEELGTRLQEIFAGRIDRTAFLQAERTLEFQAVAQVLDLMQSAGATPVGLLSSELEKNR